MWSCLSPCHKGCNLSAVSSALSLTSSPYGGKCSTSSPDRFNPGKRPRYPSEQKAESLRSRPARVRKEQTLSPLPGLQPRTASRYPSNYTDSAVMTSCLIDAPFYLFTCDFIYMWLYLCKLTIYVTYWIN